VRRPVASAARYAKTLARADQVDPTGRLACLLALARTTGRRVNAMCQLRRSDVMLQAEETAAALAVAGQDDGLVQHMPHGAIRWRAEHDKLGYEDISPISAPARAALEAYLRRHPCLGEAPLFPASKRPEEPTRKMDAFYQVGGPRRRLA
jgi:integrase